MIAHLFMFTNSANSKPMYLLWNECVSAVKEYNLKCSILLQNMWIWNFVHGSFGC